ncbi:MAG: carbon-nitrogen hydrolase family protein [Phenylobacterium sp.]|uniref:carbon-nitrogen hydrolase family protein n=1 Tax=Phenylobacterium sp. TaxID=1871053 RepID=UPI00391A7A45
MSHLAVAGLQLDLEAGDNLDRISDEVAAAKRRLSWVDLVVLGELAAYGPAVAHAQEPGGPAETRLRAMARDNRVWLVGGSIFERVGDQVFNTCPVIDPTGAVVLKYRKIYPFRPYEAGVAGGAECMTFDIPKIGRIGVSICYDMWFPETSRTLAWMGAEAIIHPGLTNTIDRDVELAIARASAAQNQCYFVDVNLAGRLGNGRSALYGPGGEAIYEAGSGRDIIAAELDLGYVRRVRERGWHGLGQVLKSFRDGPSTYPPYRDGAVSAPLAALGPLEKPEANLDPAGETDAVASPPRPSQYDKKEG